MLPVVAIVPAYNEGPRIGSVLDVLLASRAFTRVLVVSDGSTDDTEAVARTRGAEVLALRPNRGKGGAMREALAQTTEPVVAFFDADLVGLRPDHVHELLQPVVSGRAGMSVGLRDYGPRGNVIQRATPPITGERAVRRDILLRVPADFWKGFRVEAGINHAAQTSGWPVASVVLDGMQIVKKWEKVGGRRGLRDMTKMAREVVVAMSEAQQLQHGLRPGRQAVAPEITVADDGRIHGAEGFLDQVSTSVAKAVRSELLPELRDDVALQVRMGEAIGRGAAEETSFWLKLLATGTLVIAGTYAWKTFVAPPPPPRVRQNPVKTKYRRRRKRR